MNRGGSTQEHSAGTARPYPSQSESHSIRASTAPRILKEQEAGVVLRACWASESSPASGGGLSLEASQLQPSTLVGSDVNLEDWTPTRSLSLLIAVMSVLQSLNSGALTDRYTLASSVWLVLGLAYGL